MGKKIMIAEKPSVGRTYAEVLGVTEGYDGYMESDEWIITWTVGHLCTLSYPEKYDPKYKKWVLEDLPFVPEEYQYEVIADVKKQFEVVKKLYNRNDIEAIYYAGDAGREGLYIQMLVRQLAGHKPGIEEKVVWIDSQTEETIKRGIAEAKPLSSYKNLKDSGYMRAIEDYSSGINFSRILSIRYGAMLNRAVDSKKYKPISVGRVMTCVLGMVVDRELEIRNFKTTKFYKIESLFEQNGGCVKAEWKATESSRYFNSPMLYSENGFKEEADANAFIASLASNLSIKKIDRGIEKKNAPMLFNLAELQSECSKIFKISPDQTLQIAQTLYEKKMTTYPRTDARVLSSAVAKEIVNNIQGLQKNEDLERYCSRILNSRMYEAIANTKYVNDAKVTDHYAIIPTGEGADKTETLSTLERQVYELIARRFLSIFYPAAEYLKVQIQEEALTDTGSVESFFVNVKTLDNPGWLTVAGIPDEDEEKEALMECLQELFEGQQIPCTYQPKTGETTPPKRYTSGSMVLAMENAGNLIEDEDLRAQIKGTGIGTSATRAETLKKLIKLEYLKLDNKTQILTPANLGYMVYETVSHALPVLLSPKMTASWEKGLEGVATGIVAPEEYRKQLDEYVIRHSREMIETDYTKEIADGIRQYAKVKDFKTEAVFMPQTLKGRCPICGQEVVTTRYGCKCTNYGKEEGKCKFSIGEIAGVVLKADEMENLITAGRTGLIQGFTSKSKKKFSAFLVIKEAPEGKKLEFEFDTSEKLLPDVSCPKCQNQIRILPGGYACKGYDKNDPNSCHFFIGKIAGKILTEDQAKELLTSHKTKEIKGFVSKAGKKFDAALTMDEDGNISFDFGGSNSEESSITCPECSANLVKKKFAYECSCGFQIPHTIAKKTLTEEQVKQLLAGRTGLIHGFTSKKGKKFNAVLLYKEGKIEFSFPKNEN